MKTLKCISFFKASTVLIFAISFLFAAVAQAAPPGLDAEKSQAKGRLVITNVFVTYNNQAVPISAQIYVENMFFTDNPMISLKQLVGSEVEPINLEVTGITETVITATFPAGVTPGNYRLLVEVGPAANLRDTFDVVITPDYGAHPFATVGSGLFVDSQTNEIKVVEELLVLSGLDNTVAGHAASLLSLEGDINENTQDIIDLQNVSGGDGLCIGKDRVARENPNVAVGDLFEGGIVFYISEDGCQGLIAATEDVGKFLWSLPPLRVRGAERDGIFTGADGVADGAYNTNLLLRLVHLNDKVFSAAEATDDYSANVDGEPCANSGLEVCFDDWFLPSKGELNEMYLELHTVGLGNFKNSPYWSSSEFDAIDAWYQDFLNGNQDHVGPSSVPSKNWLPHEIRPVRAFDLTVGPQGPDGPQGPEGPQGLDGPAGTYTPVSGGGIIIDSETNEISIQEGHLSSNIGDYLTNEITYGDGISLASINGSITISSGHDDSEEHCVVGNKVYHTPASGGGCGITCPDRIKACILAMKQSAIEKLGTLVPNAKCALNPNEPEPPFSVREESAIVSLNSFGLIGQDKCWGDWGVLVVCPEDGSMLEFDIRALVMTSEVQYATVPGEPNQDITTDETAACKAWANF